jgi:sugar phosphate isomerase/epimerase
MQPGISTHVFLPQRLTPSLLDALRVSGAKAIEVFAARHHFDYTDRGAVRELADWFKSNDVAATMHMPLFSTDDEGNWSRHTAPSLNLIDTNKSARIDTMDEVKRALEAAEQVPFKSCVLHLGLRDDQWDPRALDDSMTAIEHLKAFASPLGMKLLLENLNNDVATPAHLMELLRVGHFDTVGVCFDVGHAHLSEEGVAAAFEVLQPRIAELHLHDNHDQDGGRGDEHLWPAMEGDRPTSLAAGTIDWKALYALTATLPEGTPGMLEIGVTQADSPETVTKLAAAVFAQQRIWAAPASA